MFPRLSVRKLKKKHACNADVCRYDCDEGTANPDDADNLGMLEITVAEIVQGRLRNGKSLQKSDRKEAMIYVSARETVDCRVRHVYYVLVLFWAISKMSKLYNVCWFQQNYVFNFIGRGLDNKDGFFGKSDPFLIFYKQVEDGR